MNIFNKIFKLMVITAVIVVTVQAVFLLNGLKVWKVDGTSMLPALENGDIVIAKKTFNYEKGDIVTLISPRLDGSYWVKRIVGTPGDIIRVYGNYIEVNGIPDEISLKHRKKDKLTGSFVLLSGEYFLAGDNRRVSADSRIVGPINEKLIVDELLLAF